MTSDNEAQARAVWDDAHLAAPAEPGDSEVITTVGDVTIRTVLSYLGDGRWRAVYWRGEHAVSCSDYPWHGPMPTGPHERVRAEMRAQAHARWLCSKFGALTDPPSCRVQAMRLSGPAPLRVSAEALAEVERRAAAEAPGRERREAIAMQREAERQQRIDMADGRGDQYMRELHWRVFRPYLVPEEG